MKYLRYFFFLIFVSPVLAEPHATEASERKIPTEFHDGRDYFSYRTPIHIDKNGEDKIVIQSFFDYDCRVCVNTQDILALYSQINPNKVVVKEYPVATKETLFSARVYYTLKQMGHTDLSDALLFETANPKRYRELAKLNNLLAWLNTQQVDTQQFKEIFYSDIIAEKITGAVYQTEKYGVFTYPFVVIDGRYVLTNSTLYSDDYTFAVLDFLVHKLSHEE